MPTFSFHDSNIRFTVATTSIGVIVTFVARIVINYHGIDVVLQDRVTIVVIPSGINLIGEQ